MQLPEELSSASLPAYLQFKREEAWNSRLSRAGKLLTLFFISTFLYLLFNSHYTASPVVVILNYMALYTGVSNLIHHKFFEIPRILLDVNKIPEGGSKPAFFTLSDQHRKEILEKTLREAGRFPIPNQVEKWNAQKITEELELEQRLPWRKIGKFYFFKYIVITACGGGLVFYSLF